MLGKPHISSLFLNSFNISIHVRSSMYVKRLQADDLHVLSSLSFTRIKKKVSENLSFDAVMIDELRTMPYILQK